MSEDRSTGPTQVIAAGVTDVGRTREMNEDNILVEPNLGLYVVADGMGGHSAGDVASALAAKTLTEYFQALRDAAASGASAEPSVSDSAALPADAQKLVAAIRKANHEIYSVSSTDSRHKGMGSTVVALLVSPETNQVHIAHVGDSRCYRVRGGAIEQMTRDHSLINEALAMKPDLTKAQIARLPKNVITRALGMASAVQVDIRTEQALPGDQFLLCSDGLSGLVNDQQMLDMLEMSDTAESACEVLIALANDAGGTDNISALVVRVPGDAEAGAEEGMGTPLTPETAAVEEAPLHAETAEEAAQGGEVSARSPMPTESAEVHADELHPDELTASEQFAVSELLRQAEEAEAAALAAQAEGGTEEGVAEEAVAEEGIAEEGLIEEGVAEEGVLEEVLAAESAAEEALIEEGVVEEGAIEEGVIEEGAIEEGLLEEGLLEEALAAEGIGEEPIAEAPVDESEAVFIAPIIDISSPTPPPEAPPAPKWAVPMPPKEAPAEGEPEADVLVEAAEAADMYSEFGDTYVGDDIGEAQLERERSPISIVPVARCRRCNFELYIGNAFCTECGLRID